MEGLHCRIHGTISDLLDSLILGVCLGLRLIEWTGAASEND
jgi:hypothetical protein